MIEICLHKSYASAVPMKERSAKNIIPAYLSGILAHKGGSVAILSNNGTEFENKVLNECPHGNSRTENVHNFLKCTFTKFLESSDLEWVDLLPFACYCYNIFPSSSSTESPFFLIFGCDPAKG